MFASAYNKGTEVGFFNTLLQERADRTRAVAAHHGGKGACDVRGGR